MKQRHFLNKFLLIAIALAFATLFVLIPVLHNHAPDLIDHQDCPSYLLATNLLAPELIFALALSIFLIFFHTVFFPQFQRKSTCSYKIFINRAPPILSEKKIKNFF